MHENVLSCDQQTVISDNTPDYKHYLIQTSPTNIGFKAARPRGYQWNTNCFEASLNYDVYDVYDYVTAQMDVPDAQLCETQLT